MVPRARFTTPRLLVAALALSAGVAAASCRTGVCERLGELWPSQVPLSAVSLPPGTFTPIMSKGGDWHTAAGDIRMEFYLARDGSEVSYSHTDTRSPSHAAEQMRREINTLYTERGAQRSFVLNGDGMKVRERVAGLRRVDTRGQNRVAVLWTEGGDLFTIEGASLEIVHEFERYLVKR